MNNRINLDLIRSEESAAVFKALSSPVRLLILQNLMENTSGLNISEIAEMFKLPLSTAALHVRVLEEAGIIVIKEKPGLRGTQKVCAIITDDVYIKFFHSKKDETDIRKVIYNMPIGNYFDFSVTKPCGMAGKKAYIGLSHSSQTFCNSNRSHAQIIWFASGYLEYRFPIELDNHDRITEINFSFEICSEAPGYNNDWPSDITVWINKHEVAAFHSTGDFGGKRGINNPDWWPDTSTQYGELRNLEITSQGCFADKRKTSNLGLDELGIRECDYISFKIGVKEDAEYAGGLNLFGEGFGNYKQNIIMTIKYEM